MTTPRKNRIALRPSVSEARLEDRLALSHVASPFSVPGSFVQPKPTVVVAPLTSFTAPISISFTGGAATPGHYNPFNPNDRTGFGPPHSR